MFAKIRDNLFITDYQIPHEIDFIKENHITAVLNVAFEVNDPEYIPTAVRAVKIFLGDYGDNKPYMKEIAIDTLVKMLQNKEVVIVHCNAGMSRSVYVTCHTLARIEKKLPMDVFKEVITQHPFALVGPLWEADETLKKDIIERLTAESAKGKRVLSESTNSGPSPDAATKAVIV